ncbi:MAG: hypothetical protein A2521_00735 [Deltaproteobacteria bacterium RIFOXYD12_FULL_57_12]|nr:MAG: hypothetical protein A2521_00735 [Deltaproteobacteria bacterium RIFOXYD12_FULL_57_12]
MSSTLSRFFLFSLMMLVLCGCARKGSSSSPAADTIYAAPFGSVMPGSYRVALFPFSEPGYAPGQGYEATRICYEELLRNGVFEILLMAPVKTPISEAEAVAMARTNSYDLILLGELRYFMTGGHLQASRVDEELRVIRVTADEARLLWHVRVAESGPPKPPRDFYLQQKEGRPAPSTGELMTRASRRFCNMLQQQPAGLASVADLRMAPVTPAATAEGAPAVVPRPGAQPSGWREWFGRMFPFFE